MALNSYLTRAEFNRNIHEIYTRSKSIQDFSWDLIQFKQKLNPTTLVFDNSTLRVEPNEFDTTDSDEDIFFLERTSQRVIQNESNESFEVPVLYLNGFRSSGSQLSFTEFQYYFMELEQIGLEESRQKRLELMNLFTQAEHPLLFKPFYFLHPCKTSEWMKSTELKASQDKREETKQKANYTLKWLSFILFALHIPFDLKFAK